MTETASRFCDLLDNPVFCENLETVAEDIEPICYITNINQSDHTRADQVLLGFAGAFLHFKRHSNPSISAGMMARIEKPWAALDQPMFCLLPYSQPIRALGLVWTAGRHRCSTLSTAVVELYRRVKSRPLSGILSEEQMVQLQAEKKQKESQVSNAFLRYLSVTRPFKSWGKTRQLFESVNGDDPILVWEQYLANPDLYELADFAILLLGLVSTKEGMNVIFRTSKSRKLVYAIAWVSRKLAQIGADIRASHKAEEGLFEGREKRKNHTDDRVKDLLAVPRYADALESGDEPEDNPEADSNGAGVGTDILRPSGNWSSTLSKLFGEDAPRPTDHRTRRPTFNREQLLMGLLAAEHSSEEPDDAELTGSGDDYED
ncbi:hypothetical protein B0H13DRAFT_1857116 [Mycena leptocephala]|nr:hypothetical protein B0H13DRAFT_1857116 [Mycena leptocephala]